MSKTRRSPIVSSTTYTYDKVGNCIRTVKDGVTTENSYNSLNQLYEREITASTGSISTTFFTYDSNGNQILEQTTNNYSTIVETIQNEYDANNQLTKTVCRDGDTSGEIRYTQENTYNSDGQRISKTEDETVTYYYYQNGVLLYTTDGNGVKTSQNIVGPDNNIIATIRYEENGQSAYFYNKDIRTSVTNVVDDAGASVVSYKYDDYGTTTKYGDADFYNEICYTSGVYDELTSLYYLNARYYNPSQKSFMTQDSYRGEEDDYGTWNLYAYCAGNPIIYIDPSGHKLVDLTKPPSQDIGYRAPKKGPKKKKVGKRKGWVDKYGNVWVPDPAAHGGEHWDVQGEDGSYTNVYPDGKRRKGKGKVKLPEPKVKNIKIASNNEKNSSQATKKVKTGVVIVVTCVVVYQAGKWIVATALAPATGGGSLVFAGATP